MRYMQVGKVSVYGNTNALQLPHARPTMHCIPWATVKAGTQERGTEIR